MVRVVQAKAAEWNEEVWVAEQIDEPADARLDPQHVLRELVRRNGAEEAPKLVSIATRRGGKVDGVRGQKARSVGVRCARAGKTRWNTPVDIL